MAPKPDPSFAAPTAAPVSNGSDPYAPYASVDNSGKGKGPHHNVAPEAADYGLVLMVFCVAFVLFVRLWRTREKRA